MGQTEWIQGGGQVGHPEEVMVAFRTGHRYNSVGESLTCGCVRVAPLSVDNAGSWLLAAILEAVVAYALYWAEYWLNVDELRQPRSIKP